MDDFGGTDEDTDRAAWWVRWRHGRQTRLFGRISARRKERCLPRGSPGVKGMQGAQVSGVG